MEKVDIQSLRSIAKIIGTIFCVGGAISMALLKGPKLLNTEFLPPKLGFVSGRDNWLLGCLSLFGSSCFWSFWVILQVFPEQNLSRSFQFLISGILFKCSNRSLSQRAFLTIYGHLLGCFSWRCYNQQRLH